MPKTDGPVDDRETVASTKTGWPLEPERQPSLPAFDRGDDRFALGAELGRGGMGRVVEATDLALDRAVAIKQATSAKPEDLLRFEREVRITARLEHPSIPPVHEAGRDAQGRPFYVMRKVAGDRLVDRIRAATTPRARLALVPNVLAAVDAAAFAHARGVIHRDIKPANILVGAYGETLLIDWGLARRLDETDAASSPQQHDDTEPLTRAGSIYGTPGYMAPEQARGDPVDARVDVYALGTTLLHALVGRAEPDVSIDQIDAAVPAELVTIIGKARAEKPEDRYADGGALANDLRAFLAGQLVAAHNYTARERLVRFVRRHRAAVLVSAAALVAAIVIGVIAIVGLSRARDHAEDAAATAESERAIAADRAEVMLLDRASTLARHDPTRAVALLRQLQPTSPHLRRARDIAAAAAAGGITRTVSAGSGPIHHLAISPDGRSVASGGTDGTLRLHVLETGATRNLTKLAERVTGIVWIDRGAALAVLSLDGLWRIAVDSGRATMLDPEARSYDLWLGPSEDRVRYIDGERNLLLERTTRDGDAPTILATGVTMGTGHGGVALVAGPAKVSVLANGRETVLAKDPMLFSPEALTISRDGSKVAAGVGNEVVEWSVSDGRILQRYPARRPTALQYGPHALYAAAQTEIVELAAGISTRLRENTQALVWSGLTALGPVFVGIDGSIVLIDDLGVQVVPAEQTTTRGIAASPHARFLVAGSDNGRVRWWDLGQRSARVYRDASGEPCGIDHARFFMYSPGSHLKVVDRASGKIQAVDHELLNQPFYCGAVLADYIVLTSPPPQIPSRAVIIDRRTFAMHQLEGASMVRGDREANKLVYLRDRRLVESSGAPGNERVRWTALAPIERFVSSKRWLAAQASGVVVRIDRTTDTLATLRVSPQETLVGMTQDGLVWFMQGPTLWSWDGTTRRELHRFAAEPNMTTSFDDQLGLYLADESLWLANRDGIANRAPPGQSRLRFGRGTAVNIEAGGTLVVRFLVSGERIVRRTHISHDYFMADDGTVVIGGGTHAIVYQDPVPLDPKQLAGWIDRTTNAWLDPKTDDLVWR